MQKHGGGHILKKHGSLSQDEATLSINKQFKNNCVLVIIISQLYT